MAFETSAVYWVGVLLIFVYALERFNTPPTNRPSTTWMRYHLAALVYVGLFQITFALIVRYPQLIEYVRALGPEMSDMLPDMADDGENPTSFTVGVAMLLSVLVPKVPGLSRMDHAVRAALQRAAAIPHEARRFAKCIQRADFTPNEPLKRAIEAHYAKLGLDETLPALDDPQPAAEQLHRLTAMMLTLETWETDRRFAGFIQQRGEQYGRLKDRYTLIVGMAKAYFELRNRSPEARADPFGEIASKFRDSFEEETRNLILEAAQLVSHTLLKCCVRASTRATELHLMGLWPTDEERRGMTADQATLLLGALVLIALLYSVLVSDITQIDTLMRVAMVPIIYTFAVVAAVVPKQHWGLFRRNPGAPPPAVGYAISGLASVTFALCVAIAFRALLQLKGNAPLSALSIAWTEFWGLRAPWLLMSFTTAVATAAVLDSLHLARVQPESRRQWLEAGTLALVIGTTGFFVWWLIANLRAGTGAAPPPLWGVVAISSIFGGLIGYTVPHWYRGSPTSRELSSG